MITLLTAHGRVPSASLMIHATRHLAAEGYVQSGSGSLTLTLKRTRVIGGKPVAATTAMLHTQLRILLRSAEWKLLEILIRRKGKNSGTINADQ